MKTVILTFSFILVFSSLSYADTHVKGYYRKDGTYVKPHVRSDPDGKKWNNYGPKDGNKDYDEKSGSDIFNDPKSKDNDDDGTPNYLDQDDDNDSIFDDDDSSQYEKE